MKKTTLAIGLLFGTFMATPALAEKTVMEQEKGPLYDVDSLKLCIDYHDLKSDTERQTYIKELDLRAQLSVKDHDNLTKNTVVPGMTMCGMYMTTGKPVSEHYRQIRPMTFKTVHIYPDMYHVTQSGLVVESYERKEGELPPQLVKDAPAVQPPPVLYGTPMHHMKTP